MKTLICIATLALSSMAYGQISLPYYEDFEDTEAQGWTMNISQSWYVSELTDGNWVFYSKKETDGNSYYHLFSPTFTTNGTISPRFRCEAKFNRMNSSWNCAPQLGVVVENLDNSEQFFYEYGSAEDFCSSEDVSVNDNFLFSVSRPLPPNANVRVRLIANFYDPGWLYIDNVEVLDLNSSGMEETMPFKSFRVYPSPANEKATVSASFTQEEDFKIEVLNQLGQVMWQSSVSVGQGVYNEEIDVRDFSAGIYFVRLSNDSFITSRKFVKQ